MLRAVPIQKKKVANSDTDFFRIMFYSYRSNSDANRFGSSSLAPHPLFASVIYRRLHLWCHSLFGVHSKILMHAQQATTNNSGKILFTDFLASESGRFRCWHFFCQNWDRFPIQHLNRYSPTFASHILFICISASAFHSYLHSYMTFICTYLSTYYSLCDLHLYLPAYIL